jgi:hypothetical protein
MTQIYEPRRKPVRTGRSQPESAHHGENKGVWGTLAEANSRGTSAGQRGRLRDDAAQSKKMKKIQQRE